MADSLTCKLLLAAFGDGVEDAVDEAERLRGGVALRDLERFVDDDGHGCPGKAQQFCDTVQLRLLVAVTPGLLDGDDIRASRDESRVDSRLTGLRVSEPPPHVPRQ